MRPCVVLVRMFADFYFERLLRTVDEGLPSPPGFIFIFTPGSFHLPGLFYIFFLTLGYDLNFGS